MKSSLANITQEELENLIKSSDSIRDIMIKLNITASSGNYRTFYRKIKKFNISLDDMFIVRRKSGKRTNNPPMSTVLTENSSYAKQSLKRGIISEGYVENICAKCGQVPEWDGMPLVLQLDHINGVNDDNRIDNLRLLCPNCHSQTSSYSGKNKTLIERSCIKCGKKLKSSRKTSTCANCYYNRYKQS